MKLLSISILIFTSVLLCANPPKQAVNSEAFEAAIEAGKK
tara:strand:+ start:1726 stop:1845 length:120 start_codon:yes stop_codon:yes gene_type:complete